MKYNIHTSFWMVIYHWSVSWLVREDLFNEVPKRFSYQSSGCITCNGRLLSFSTILFYVERVHLDDLDVLVICLVYSDHHKWNLQRSYSTSFNLKQEGLHQEEMKIDQKRVGIYREKDLILFGDQRWNVK